MVRWENGGEDGLSIYRSRSGILARGELRKNGKGSLHCTEAGWLLPGPAQQPSAKGGQVALIVYSQTSIEGQVRYCYSYDTSRILLCLKRRGSCSLCLRACVASWLVSRLSVYLLYCWLTLYSGCSWVLVWKGMSPGLANWEAK